MQHQDNSNDEQEDRLTKGYDGLMRRARELLEEAGPSSVPTLDELVKRAADAVVEVGELTSIEAQRIATWVRDDLRDAAQDLRETGHELRDWLRFDLEVLETRLRERLEVLVDHTRQELERLDAEAHAAREVHTGEVVGPGTVFCQSCGQPVTLKTSGRVPPCPKCHGTLFAHAVRHVGD